MARGAQHAVTQERIALDHGVAVRMMRDLAAGVDYLHSEKVSRLHQLWRLRASGRGEKRQGAPEMGTPVCQVLHRDIKTANLLVGERLTLKLTDFGFAKLKANWCLPSACPLAGILEYTTKSTAAAGGQVVPAALSTRPMRCGLAAFAEGGRLPPGITWHTGRTARPQPWAPQTTWRPKWSSRSASAQLGDQRARSVPTVLR